MRARLTTALAGANQSHACGDIVDGALALQVLAAGYGVPISDAPAIERATVDPVAERATRKRK